MIIYLVGYMGTGKSHLGKMLAQLLDFDFIDTDQLIEDRVGKPISKIFDEDGENAFRSYEAELIRELNTENTIVSCGGGLPCFNDNMDYLLIKGRVIWIKSSVKDIVDRVIEGDERPLLKDQKHKLTNYIKTHLKSRKPIYQRSHIKVWNRGPEISTINRIITYLRYLDSVSSE